MNGDLVAPSVKPGDRVLVEAHAGIDVKDGDEKYIIIGEANILAIIEE
ncbi:10 kDa chaperonin [Streptococcus oralis SK255]|uniref:10 kDa chaperonin n=1 Tax=Streptococcus oralis SK255 TaxID=1005704 RepID=F5VUE5_STROR|nr:10 kDa chaperonin [Streptococcus oralis SK255]